MEGKKVLLDAIVPLQRLDELRLRGDGLVHSFNFALGLGVASAGTITLGPLQRLRLTLTVEPVVVNLRTPQEHALDTARERMRSNLVRLQAAGYWPVELDELAASVDNLVSARVALALRVHCDADHDFDD